MPGPITVRAKLVTLSLMKLPFSWGRESGHAWENRLYGTPVVIPRQTQGKDPTWGWGYSFRVQPSLSKDPNDARVHAIQVLGSAGLGLPAEPSRGPCDCSRQAKGDGSRERGGRALVMSQITLRASAFLLP